MSLRRYSDLRPPVDSKLDVEIRDVVGRLNAVPGVATIFSCAGYGRAGEADVRHPSEMIAGKPLDHRPHKGLWHGNLVVAYDDLTSSLPGEVHEALEFASVRTRVMPFWERKLGIPVYSYEFGGTSDVRDLEYNWRTVRRLLEIVTGGWLCPRNDLSLTIKRQAPPI